MSVLLAQARRAASHRPLPWYERAANFRYEHFMPYAMLMLAIAAVCVVIGLALR